MHGALFSIFIVAAIFELGFAAGYGVHAAISRNRRSRAWRGFDRRPRSPAAYPSLARGGWRKLPGLPALTPAARPKPKAIIKEVQMARSVLTESETSNLVAFSRS